MGEYKFNLDKSKAKTLVKFLPNEDSSFFMQECIPYSHSGMEKYKPRYVFNMEVLDDTTKKANNGKVFSYGMSYNMLAKFLKISNNLTDCRDKTFYILLEKDYNGYYKIDCVKNN